MAAAGSVTTDPSNWMEYFTGAIWADQLSWSTPGVSFVSLTAYYSGSASMSIGAGPEDVVALRAISILSAYPFPPPSNQIVDTTFYTEHYLWPGTSAQNLSFPFSTSLSLVIPVAGRTTLPFQFHGSFNGFVGGQASVTADFRGFLGFVGFLDQNGNPMQHVGYAFENGTLTGPVSVTPEPAAGVLMATGILALGLLWKRRRPAGSRHA